jgi:hypothetical protein
LERADIRQGNVGKKRKRKGSHRSQFRGQT